MPIEVHGDLDEDTSASNPGGLEVVDAVYDRCFPGRALNREHFRQGCINPAMALGGNLMAVSTDLSSNPSAPDCPVIKIVSQPLDKMAFGPVQKGQRLATISVYHPGDHLVGRWWTFTPVAANCLSDDAAAVQRLVSSIPPEDWTFLEQAMEKIPARQLQAGQQWELTDKGWKPDLTVGPDRRRSLVVPIVCVVVFVIYKLWLSPG